MKFFTIFLIMTVMTLLLTQRLFAHEQHIQDVVEHSEYLHKMQVKSFGDLRLIKKNQLNKSILFSQIQSDDLYGIGMPEGLDTELLITSGELYEGKFDDHVYSAGLVKEDRDIAFLAYAQVENWKEVTLPDDITSFAKLEKAVPLLAKQAGINTEAPFPFILRSKVEGLKWFIVDGMGNGKPDYLNSFLRSRYIGGLQDVDIEGLGFYSDKHRGVLSAPSSAMHIHFRTVQQPLFVGHIDNQMMLGKGAVLLFPSME